MSDHEPITLQTVREAFLSPRQTSPFHQATGRMGGLNERWCPIMSAGPELVHCKFWDCAWWDSKKGCCGSISLQIAQVEAINALTEAMKALSVPDCGPVTITLPESAAWKPDNDNLGPCGGE